MRSWNVNHQQLENSKCELKNMPRKKIMLPCMQTIVEVDVERSSTKSCKQVVKSTQKRKSAYKSPTICSFSSITPHGQ